MQQRLNRHPAVSVLASKLTSCLRARQHAFSSCRSHTPYYATVNITFSVYNEIFSVLMLKVLALSDGQYLTCWYLLYIRHLFTDAGVLFLLQGLNKMM
jgi:hypothetical protein